MAVRRRMKAKAEEASKLLPPAPAPAPMPLTPRTDEDEDDDEDDKNFFTPTPIPVALGPGSEDWVQGENVDNCPLCEVQFGVQHKHVTRRHCRPHHQMQI